VLQFKKYSLGSCVLQLSSQKEYCFHCNVANQDYGGQHQTHHFAAWIFLPLCCLDLYVAKAQCFTGVDLAQYLQEDLIASMHAFVSSQLPNECCAQ